MAVSCAAPRRAAASASADGVARPARPSRPAGRTVPRCCPQAACASGPAIARCPARAPARQPRHYSDPGFPGRLGTQRRAGAVWRLGPGPSLADVGRGSLATPPRQTQSQGPAPYPALLHELYKRLAQRAAHPLSQPPASRPPACQCPPRQPPVVSPQFPPACSGNVPQDPGRCMRDSPPRLLVRGPARRMRAASGAA